jgi:hypothetical protein
MSWDNGRFRGTSWMELDEVKRPKEAKTIRYMATQKMIHLSGWLSVHPGRAWLYLGTLEGGLR